jgi:uncharacterized protein YxeA
MKKLLIIITLCVLSVVAAYGQSNKPSLDTIKKPMTDEQRKYQEYLQWQQKTNHITRSAQNDKNLETIDQQATTLDSLIIQQPAKKASAPKKK